MKIVHKKEKCIGCGACVNACPGFFKMGRDGKATLEREGRKIEKKNGKEVLEVEKPGCAERASEVCPVQCIIIEK